MQRHFRIVCRGSLLSQAQAELFRARLLNIVGRSTATIIIKDTAGDRIPDAVLQDIEGKDFFTKDIQDFLRSGHADFAVHSLKDVSSDQFFSGSKTAVVERDDPRDVAIFHMDVPGKIASGKPIRIGTSSPRRAFMAAGFLQKALPALNERGAVIETAPIRGNVDTRLKKLSNAEYDGVILAVAGINRLLNYAPSSMLTRERLKDKLIMVLPLFECPPAPGQGAIVVETAPGNGDAADVLQVLNDPDLEAGSVRERAFANQYGSGCHQQFGVVHIKSPHGSFTYGSGIRSDSTPFEEYRFVPEIPREHGSVFSFGDLIKSFFSYRYLPEARVDSMARAVFISSHKAVHAPGLLGGKKVWAAGTKTWLRLAGSGIWVEGCADALGLEFIAPLLASPLVGAGKQDIQIVTDTESAEHWKESGWNAVGTIELGHEVRDDLINSLRQADIVFWTSFRQYRAYKDHLTKNVQHCCSSGKTVDLLLREGIRPTVFPGIRAFNEWRKRIPTETVTEG